MSGPRPPSASARTGRLAAGLVRLYPRRWRERYGGELLELLADRRVTPVGVLATLRGALDAHLTLPELLPGPAGRAGKVRWYVVEVLAAWVAFCLAAAGAAKTLEDPAFGHAAAGRPALEVARTLAGVAFVLAAAAVVAGGLPLVGTAAWQGVRQQRRAALALLLVPLGGAVLLPVSAWLLGRLHLGHPHSAGTVAVAASWFVLVLALAVAALRAVGALVTRAETAPGVLRCAGWAGVVAAASMTVGVLSGAAYGLAVWLTSPALFVSPNGVLATPLPVTWAAALLLAAAAVAVADRAALRAARALRVTE